MADPEIARNILFGLLAVQQGHVTQSQLFDAIKVWNVGGAEPLGKVLVAHNVILPEICKVLDDLADAQFDQRDHREQSSLATADWVQSVPSAPAEQAGHGSDNTISHIPMTPSQISSAQSNANRTKTAPTRRTSNASVYCGCTPEVGWVKCISRPMRC